jgi:hypothetical protein
MEEEFSWSNLVDWGLIVIFTVIPPLLILIMLGIIPSPI